MVRVLLVQTLPIEVLCQMVSSVVAPIVGQMVTGVAVVVVSIGMEVDTHTISTHLPTQRIASMAIMMIASYQTLSING